MLMQEIGYFREIVSNTLAHRDYSSGYPAKMIIDDEKITVENSNLAHGVGALDLQKFEPFPKKPCYIKGVQRNRSCG